MRFRHRLRYRIIISFLLFGILLGGMFAITALGMREYLKSVLIDETLDSDLNAEINNFLAGSEASESGFSSRYYAWFGRPEAGWASTRLLKDLPGNSELRGHVVELIVLSDGVHQLNTATRQYKVAVNKREDLWGYLIYDVTPNPQEWIRLLALLTGAFVVFLALALMLAIWSSKRIMAPVSDLARRISGMGQDVHPEPLAPAYADDEVGQLAKALDEYADRLTALVVRDKEFNADVSHELRSPLTVIQSATELLMAQPGLEEKTKVRLHRIKRATKQSTELTEALLHLVRAERVDRATGEYYRIDRIVEEVVDFKKHQLGNKPVEVKVNVEDSFLVCAPNAVIAVTLGNLIGNAFKYTPLGSVEITVGNGRVVVEDTGPGLEDSELQKVFDRHYRGSTADGKGSGLGLAIVQRFCELYEWTVDIKTRDAGGLRTVISFGQVK